MSIDKTDNKMALHPIELKRHFRKQLPEYDNAVRFKSEKITFLFILKRLRFFDNIYPSLKIGSEDLDCTYIQAIEYLNETAALKNLKHPLNTLTDFLKVFSSPQDSLNVIHVAGTNGKGSACAMLTYALTEAGYKVGTFTSPHLVRFNERLSVNGREITDAEFAGLLSEVRESGEKYLNRIHGTHDRFSFFEILTAMAFIYFKEMSVDFAVMETGLGGRLDSTNIIRRPLLSVITNIGLDHMDILGLTVESIASEKAGIIKKNCPAVLYLNSKEVYNVIKETAEGLNSKFYYNNNLSLEILKSDLSGSLFSVKSDYYSYKDIFLNLPGSYQLDNASGTLLAVRALNDCGVCISPGNVREAFKKVKWACRMEAAGAKPLILIDGAHNVDGAEAFGRAMESVVEGRIILVAGILKDKPYRTMMEHLTRRADTVIVTAPDNPRALSPDILAGAVSGSAQKRVIAVYDCRDAFDKALSLASDGDCICIAGSLYLAGALREYITGRDLSRSCGKEHGQC